MANPPYNPSRSSVKCGHCHGYHSGPRGVFFCANGPHAQSNQRRADNARASVPTIKTDPPAWSLNVPRAMVENLKNGRYATRPDTDTPFTFIRVSRPKRGRLNGCLVIQTQHSDWYQDFITIYPSGSVWFKQSNDKLDMALFIACADPMTSAMNYGKELGRCSSCGRELTDERSRYYSIGPECEKHWREIIEHVNEETGVFYPGIR